MVPTAARPPYSGLLPDPRMLSEAGLTRAAVKDWHAEDESMDLIQIIADLPANTEKSVKEIQKKIDEFDKPVAPAPAPAPTPAPAPSPSPKGKLRS